MKRQRQKLFRVVLAGVLMIFSFMVYAQERIVTGDMSPALVAGGIKVALITTVGGLIVAMILQVFYNYCVSKVEGIVNNMEDASVSMLDILVKYEQKNK